MAKSKKVKIVNPEFENQEQVGGDEFNTETTYKRPFNDEEKLIRKDYSKGIILLAIGKPAYGKMAANMAVSLKYHNPDLNIQLIHEKEAISHLNEFHLSFFDILTEIKPEHCREKTRLAPALAKLNLYDYAEYAENIYLDVDGICIKDISPIWEMCKGKEYLSQMSGFYEIKDADNDFKALQWARVSDIVKYYGLKTGDIIPAINSSFQYIKKCDKVKELFDLAKELLSNPIPTGLHPEKWTKEDQQPDELYMDVAMAKLKHNPDLGEEVICFSTKPIKESVVNEKYYFIGLYGPAQFTSLTLREYADRILHKIYRGHYRKEHLYKVKTLLGQKI